MSTNLPIPTSPPKPVRLLYSIAAGAAALTTVLASIDGVPRWVVAVVAGVGVVLTAGLGRYTETQTTPWQNVAALYVDQTGNTVAGPASVVKTGSPVDVTDISPSAYTPPSVSPPAV